MLPFLKRNQEAASSTPIEAIERKPDEGAEEIDTLEVAAQDILDAMHKKDAKALAEALRAAFELMDSEPHVEGPHIEE